MANVKHTKLLLDSPPLVVIPELACAIGLNEAIVLQQVNYWIQHNTKAEKNIHDGRVWAYNSIEQWQRQFPFWSVATVKRIFRKLEDEGILLSGNYNKLKMDRTKWYSIDFESFECKYPGESIPMNISFPLDQIDQMDKVELTQAVPETITEIKNGKNGKDASTVSANRVDVPRVYKPDPEIIEFMNWYFHQYWECFGEDHPNIKAEQKLKVHNILKDFCDENCLDIDGLQEMANSFFDDVPESDHNINHFATPGILKIRFYQSFY